eukprot:GAHX01001725.1.p1 GENE.GAHX01001725.1~~GAHX01001725.1.p1  ORF type:complete len:273 (-),score=21.96 GAHX01001725.1:24-842(-)
MESLFAVIMIMISSFLLITSSIELYVIHLRRKCAIKTTKKQRTFPLYCIAESLILLMLSIVQIACVGYKAGVYFEELLVYLALDINIICIMKFSAQISLDLTHFNLRKQYKLKAEKVTFIITIVLFVLSLLATGAGITGSITIDLIVDGTYSMFTTFLLASLAGFLIKKYVDFKYFITNITFRRSKQNTDQKKENDKVLLQNLKIKLFSISTVCIIVSLKNLTVSILRLLKKISQNSRFDGVPEYINFITDLSLLLMFLTIGSLWKLVDLSK